MKTDKDIKNPCPVCKETTKEDSTMIYCEHCGMSIRKNSEELKQKPTQA